MTPRSLLPQVRRIRVTARRVVRSLAAGEYAAAFKGAGLAFEDVREYQPGDDVRRIDWNVTARTGNTVIKRFVEERDLTLLLAVDLSASLDFGSTGVRKRTVAAELAAVLASAALQQRDRVGFVGFTHHVERHVRPGRSRNHLSRILRDILQYTPTHRGTDLNAVLTDVQRAYRRRVVLVILSDFLNDASSVVLRRVAALHDVIAIRISDPREHAWPATGLVSLVDAETGTPVVIDTGSAAFRTQYVALAKQRDESFRKLTRTAQVEALDVSTAGGHLDALLQFFHRRGRR